MKTCMRLATHPKYMAGGAERQMELIARLLKEKKVDISIIVNKLFKHQKDLEVINGIKVYSIGKKRKNLITRLIKAWDLSIFFKNFFRFKYDIYHLRCADIIIGIWGFFVKYLKRKRYIFTAAHIWDCIPGTHHWNRLFERIYRFGIQNADVVVVLADYMKKEMDKNFNTNSLVIKSGHPIPPDNIIKQDPPVILWISRLIDWKRPDLFLKIAAELEDLNAEFILIGPGNYMKNEIIDFSNRHNNFKFIPGVPQGEDNIYYSKASLLVNTSSYEGFPNAFIQAWLYKTPVLSLDVDPDCDICHNNLGFHAKGDINKLINEIKNFCLNPLKLKETGEKCRHYAITTHDIKITTEKYYMLYNNLLK